MSDFFEFFDMDLYNPGEPLNLEESDVEMPDAEISSSEAEPSDEESWDDDSVYEESSDHKSSDEESSGAEASDEEQSDAEVLAISQPQTDSQRKFEGERVMEPSSFFKNYILGKTGKHLHELVGDEFFNGSGQSALNSTDTASGPGQLGTFEDDGSLLVSSAGNSTQQQYRSEVSFPGANTTENPVKPRNPPQFSGPGNSTLNGPRPGTSKIAKTPRAPKGRTGTNSSDYNEWTAKALVAELMRRNLTRKQNERKKNSYVARLEQDDAKRRG